MMSSDNSNLTFSIITKGGRDFGFGHLIRTKSFVNWNLKEANFQVIPILEKKHHNFFSDLNAVVDFVESESEAKEKVKEQKPDGVIFDTTSFDYNMFDELTNLTLLSASLSPIFNQNPLVDIRFTRKPSENNEENGIFGGLKYAIFNQNCFQVSDEEYIKNLSTEELKIGIAMGGGDAPNKTLKVLKELNTIETPCTFWVLLGEGYNHSYQDLVNVTKTENNHEVILAKTNRSMWSILSNCSLAIFAGGLTTVEAIYAGIPSLNLFQKEEHLNTLGKEVFELGPCKNMGLIEKGGLEFLKDEVSSLLINKSKLLEMREKATGLVDKMGPYRIMKKIKEAHSKRLNKAKISKNY